MAEENGRSNEMGRMKTDFTRVLGKNPRKTTFLVCKAVEVILCIIAIALIEHSFDPIEEIRRNFFYNIRDVAKAITVYTTLYGYILINGVLVISHLTGEQLSKKMLMLFAGAGTILCCISGVLLTAGLDDPDYDMYRSRHNQFRPSGICTLLASVIFGLDTLLTFKYA